MNTVWFQCSCYTTVIATITFKVTADCFIIIYIFPPDHIVTSRKTYWKYIDPVSRTWTVSKTAKYIRSY